MSWVMNPEAAVYVPRKKDSKVAIAITSCMGNKVFDTNHSAVLSIKTVWCPNSWLDKQEEDAGPDEKEFAIYGFRQNRKWQIAALNQTASQVVTVNGDQDDKIELLDKERHLANVQSDLTCVVGGEKGPDDKFLFSQMKELAWEDSSGIVWGSLWRAIEKDERCHIEKRQRHVTSLTEHRNLGGEKKKKRRE